MSKPLLNNKDIYPTDDVIKEVLKESFDVFKEFTNRLLSLYPEINLEWKYYNDGKSWLCKCVLKKKTFFWLSIWDELFKISIFYNEKTIIGLDPLLIESAEKNSNVGKLIPIIYSVNKSETLIPLFKTLEHRKKAI